MKSLVSCVMTPRRVGRPSSAASDELLTPEVGTWAEKKYDLFWNYANMFTTSMKSKWDQLAYVDLFSGPGKVRVRGTPRILHASPLLAQELPSRFDHHVYCESEPDALSSLERRMTREYPEASYTLLPGDVNEQVPEILEALPSHGPGKTVLGLCFVDPYRLRNLKFDTIRALAQSRLLDFLVLIPSGMDATRNEGTYLSPEDLTVDKFIGRGEWREQWAAARRTGTTFDVFLTDSFGQSMTELGYIYRGIHDTQLVRLPEKRVRLYRLVLFSRHKLGKRFWDQTKESSDPQRSFDY